MAEELVILVDTNDRPVGSGEKLAVHKAAQLHRAFSICIFNREGKMLLQRRALSKYHSPGLWTNACCGHPRPAETILEAAGRRLNEEMELACPLSEGFSFIYRASLDDGLTEHEYDHVLFGTTDKQPRPNPAEAMDYRWIALDDLEADIQRHPEAYTFWFKLMMAEHGPLIARYASSHL